MEQSCWVAGIRPKIPESFSWGENGKWLLSVHLIQRLHSLAAWCRALGPISFAETRPPPPWSCPATKIGWGMGNNPQCSLTLAGTKPHLMLPSAWITRGFFCFFFLVVFSSTTNLSSREFHLRLLSYWSLPHPGSFCHDLFSHRSPEPHLGLLPLCTDLEVPLPEENHPGGEEVERGGSHVGPLHVPDKLGQSKLPLDVRLNIWWGEHWAITYQWFSILPAPGFCNKCLTSWQSASWSAQWWSWSDIPQIFPKRCINQI